MQIIFHIDLNAFFASAEVSIHPELSGKPIVISHDSRRGIVSTASYEARAFGIHSAMPLFKAKELCKDLVVVEPHFELYKSLSNQFFDIIKRYSLLVEIASIDECYVDVTEYIKEQNIHPIKLAKEIQNKVSKELSLTCSIGIAPNKFLAKMGSDMKKPNGITLLTLNNIKEKLWPLPIGDMFGIGKKTAPKLIEIGIETIGDLAKYKNYEKIRPLLGKSALIYYHRANGRDYSKLNPYQDDLKSLGHSRTFENDSNDEEFIKSVFRDLSHNVAERAQRNHLISNSISITLKYTREKSRTKQTIIETYTNDYDIIYATALLLFENIYQGEMIRLVGVSLNNVVRIEEANQQLSLFNYQEASKQSHSTEDIIKNLNKSLDSNAFIKASELFKKNNH